MPRQSLAAVAFPVTTFPAGLFNNFADVASLCLDFVDLGSIIAYSAADSNLRLEM